jgi:hypothetical protein
MRTNVADRGVIDLNIAARERGFALEYGSWNTRGYCNPPVDLDRANEEPPRGFGPVAMAYGALYMG